MLTKHADDRRSIISQLQSSNISTSLLFPFSETSILNALCDQVNYKSVPTNQASLVMVLCIPGAI
jgi:hypothetical protein